MDETRQIDGVSIGLLLGFEENSPLVVFPGNPCDHAVTARSLARLTEDDVGGEVALMFEDGDLRRPLILGRIQREVRKTVEPTVIHDGETVRVSAEKRLELRVGKASIILEQDGRVTIRGTNVTTQASAANRLRGGSIHLN